MRNIKSYYIYIYINSKSIRSNLILKIIDPIFLYIISRKKNFKEAIRSSADLVVSNRRGRSSPENRERDCQGRRWQAVKDEARSRLRAFHIGRKNRQPWGSLLERRPTKLQTTGDRDARRATFFSLSLLPTLMNLQSLTGRPCNSWMKEPTVALFLSKSRVFTY